MRPAPALAALAALALAIPTPAPAAISRTFRYGAAGYTGTKDVAISDELYRFWDPTRNYNITCTNCNTDLVVDGDPVDVAILLRFDLSLIPAGATVTAVDLTFQVADTSGAFQLYELKKDFVDSEATWNQARAGVPWEQPGAAGGTDRGSAVLGTYAPPNNPVPFQYTLNFAPNGVAAVQGWVSSPASNHGFIIADTTVANGASVGSSDDTTPANRPFLRVSYLLGATPFILSFQNGISPSLTYAGTRDTVIGNGTNANLNGGSLHVDGFEEDYSTLIRFDVSAIPPWSTVTSVSMDGYVTNTSSQSYPIYEMLRDFSDTSANWFNADSTTPWSMVGGSGAGTDHGSTVLGLWSPRNNNAFNSTPLNRLGAKLVQDWVRGVKPNRGLILQDYADAMDDGAQWDDAGSQQCDNAVPANCFNSSPGLTVVYNEGRFGFTSAPQRIQVGAPSAPFTVQRQRADDGVPIAVASAPALGVTIRSSSAGGAFALAPTGPWSSTLSVSIPSGASDSQPFYYRDAFAGSPTLTASLTAAWVNGTQGVSVGTVMLADDVESGQLDVSSGGQWTQTSAAPSCSVSAVTAAAHRGTFGLRVVDADGQAGGGPQAEAQYLSAPVGADLYFRTWFRYSGSNQLGDAQLAAVGGGPLASTSLALPARALSASGVTDAGVASGETGSLVVSEGDWHLLELFANNIGFTSGVRRTYVDGQLNTSATGLDWSGLGADAISVGEPFSSDRQLTATLDFDDLRASTSAPASTLVVTAPATVPLNACTAVAVSMRDSTGNGPSDMPYDFTAALRLDVPGAFFSDSTCSTPISSVSFPQGIRTVTAYVTVAVTGSGTITASFPDLLDGSDSFTVVTGQPLAVSPSSIAIGPHGVVGLTAAGGSGAGYRWSFLVNRSGATLSPGGVYTAGGTPLVTDVVQVTDSLGASATGSISVTRALVLAPPKAVVFPFGQVSFSSPGANGAARYSIPDNRSGALIGPTSGVYNAGGTAGAVDTVSVVDEAGAVATSTVQVLSPSDFRLNVTGSTFFTAGGSATYGFQVVDLSGLTVALPSTFQVRLLPIPGGPPLQATMTSTFTGADAGSPPSTGLTLFSNGNGFANAVVTSRAVERFFVCGALASDARTEACTLVQVNPGAAHHVRADAVPGSATSCTPARIDVTVVDTFQNNVGFSTTVQLCPSGGSSASLVSSTLGSSQPSGSCLIGVTSGLGTASVFAVDGMDETVTFTPSSSAVTNPPVAAQVTWSGRAPSPSQTLLELVGATDPAPLGTAPGSSVTVHVSPRDACGQPIAFAVASEVALQLPPPLQATGPTVDSTGFSFSVTSPSCPPLPADPLPIHASLSGAPVTTPSGALAAVDVLVSCRAPRFVSQGATGAQCNQPYRYSAARVPEVDGDGPFVFRATGLPPGATLSPSGELLWVPTPDQVGAYPVELTVVGATGSDTQTLTIDVACGSTVPPAPCGCQAASAAPLALAALVLLRGAGARLRRRRSARAPSPG